MKKMSCSISICTVLLIALSTGGHFAQAATCGLRPCGPPTPPPPPPPPPPTGSCQPSSSLGILVTGTNAVAYVPKGNWGSITTGVSAINIEGTSITPTLISTPNVVNSCAANPITGQTVCAANNTDVYLIKGTTLSTTLTSGGSGTIGFSGGSCTNCSVVIDSEHNKAVIGLSIDGAPGFQILNLKNSVFHPAVVSPSGRISENPLIDPSRRLLLSAAENNTYEIVDVKPFTAPTFFENTIPNPTFSFGEADSAGEDCVTGIALAGGEGSSPSQVFIADLTQAVFTAGSPGTWTAPSQVQTLTESSLSAGASGIAVAQGTHTGIVSGEFGGNTITAIALPATSGSGTPAIGDWVSCNIAGFNIGDDPHTVTAYQSPNGAKDAIALVGNLLTTATQVAVIDLTKMLNTTIVPRTVAGHGCASLTLPASVVSFVTVP
jgi:hypothetical protein